MSIIDQNWFDSSFDSKRIEVEIDYIKPKNKRAKLEEVVIDFYKELADVNEPNHYDEWIDRTFQLYNQAWRLPEIFVELGDRLALLNPDMLYEGTEGISEILFQMCSAYLKGKEKTKRIIRAYINERFHDVIEVKKRYVQMDMTDTLNAEILHNIAVAKETDLQKMAKRLDDVVLIGATQWEYILYSVLSVSAPDIMINGVMQRGNCHTNLIGEISTAKSKILNVLKRIAPKWVNVTKTTEASFEGISKPNEIQAGLIENSTDGLLLIPEFKRTISKFSLLREAMDCDIIDITKRGVTHRFKVNSSFIVASNPTGDFFPVMGRMRDAIPFEEGIMSRFDFILPFLMNEKKNKEIVAKLILFGGDVKDSEFEKMGVALRTLTEGMKIVKSIYVSPEQTDMLKEAYLKNNIQLNGGFRPLVILRDLETLCRLVNVIVATNFYNRIPTKNKGEFEALDVDVEKAIDLWENLLFMRKQMYEARNDKNLVFADEAILNIVMAMEEGEIGSQGLFKAMMNLDLAGSERSCSRRIKRLVEGKILKMEKRKGEDGQFVETVYSVNEEIFENQEATSNA